MINTSSLKVHSSVPCYLSLSSSPLSPSSYYHYHHLHGRRHHHTVFLANFRYSFSYSFLLPFIIGGLATCNLRFLLIDQLGFLFSYESYTYSYLGDISYSRLVLNVFIILNVPSSLSSNRSRNVPDSTCRRPTAVLSEVLNSL